MLKRPKIFKNVSFSRLIFVVSAILVIYFNGILLGKYHLFPTQVVTYAEKGFYSLLIKIKPTRAWYYKFVGDKYTATHQQYGSNLEGINLISKIGIDKQLMVEIVDMKGNKIHEWLIDWFKIWPDAEHLPESYIPKQKPGAFVHGAIIMENGDLIFNFEGLGLVRLDRKGEVVWRLPYQTHHTVHQHDDGNVWVCGFKMTEPFDSRFPNRNQPFREPTLLEITTDGVIVNEWSVADLLIENGLIGLLHINISDKNSRKVLANMDRLHLNDVEPFPASMKEDYFKKGDILVSLRNVNTVFVFNRYNRRIKFICTGWFVWQHDPDFIDGNSFSVFDNNNIAPENNGHQSRIVIVSARDRKSKVFFEGNYRSPFYTDIMGKHQWLENGNLLVTEAKNGRAFEINPQGKIMWEYVNYVDHGIIGAISEVQRLPLEYRKLFEPNGYEKH